MSCILTLVLNFFLNPIYPSVVYFPSPPKFATLYWFHMYV